MEMETQHGRGFRQQAIAAVAIVFVALMVWVFWPRAPLQGETSFDFGTVTFETAPHSVEHTFSLVNTSADSLQVMRTSSSCGCTEAVLPGEVIAPGGTLEFPVRLRLTHSGLKEAVVTVYFYNGQWIDVAVQATGKLVRSLRAVPRNIRLRPPRGLGNTTLWMESNTKPPIPEITSPERLEVTFMGWKQTGEKNDETATPASWTGEVVLQGSGEGPPPGSTITLAMPDGEQIEVGVNRRSFVPLPTTDDPLPPPQPAGDS
ncbi:MAG: DUF1573 domain-containing protein [Phycisphaerales bacterium]|jgi:hypothetical protein|nr:DUF1573 domain-containing protein [Phycisphaerales bacterium]